MPSTSLMALPAMTKKLVPDALYRWNKLPEVIRGVKQGIFIDYCRFRRSQKSRALFF